MILWMIRLLLIDIDLERYWPRWHWLPMRGLLALGPLLYMYVRKLTRVRQRFMPADLVHFIPLLFELAVYVYAIRESSRTGMATYATHFLSQVDLFLQVFVFISVLSYLWLCDNLIHVYYRGLQPVLMDRSLLEFKWLRRLLAGTAFLLLAWLACSAYGYFSTSKQPGLETHYPFYCLFAVVLIWTAAAAFLQPRANPPWVPTAAGRIPVSPELRSKARWLQAEMKAKRYFEDPELGLQVLAEKVNLTPHELSRVINTGLKKSFTDFVNEYRVQDAVKKMQHPGYQHMTLLGIGFEAGFNSKTTFNRIFKEITGKSPSEYKNDLKKQRPDYNMERKTPDLSVILRPEPRHARFISHFNPLFMFRNYCKTAFRNLLQNKVYSFINIAGLSVGLACTLLIMLYVQDELSFDRFHQDSGQIYRIDKQTVRNDGSVSTGGYTGYFPGPRFSAKIPELKTFVRFQTTRKDIKAGEDLQSQEVCLVDSNFLSVFHFPLLSGNPKTALSDPSSVVITEEIAEKYFGKSDALGKTIVIKQDSSFSPFVITGIARNCPENSSITFQVLLPLKVSAASENNNGNWFNSFLTTFVVVSPGADIRTVERKMAQVFEADASKAIGEIKSKYGVKSIGISYLLEPLVSIHLGRVVPQENESLQRTSNPEFSYVLSAIAIFILLIACINFVNLTVARSGKRAREIGIRKVMGSTIGQLRVQFLSESLALCLVAFSLALGISILVLPLFSQLSNKVLHISYLFSIKLISCYIMVFLITALLAGFYPSIVLSNYNPVEALYSRFSLAGKSYLQIGLVVFQFALASFLIIGSITFFLQFNFLTTQSLGYDDSNVITVNKPGLSSNEAALFKQELLKNPSILLAATKNGGDDNNTVKADRDKQVNVAVETIDASYLPLLKVPVKIGRNFSSEYVSDAGGAVIVNEAFVKEAGWSDPLGQKISTFEKGEMYTVIGVVKDYHYKPLTQKIGPQLFSMNPNHSRGQVFVKIKDGTGTTSLQYIEKTFKKLFPFTPFVYSFKQEQNEQSYATEARWKQIILWSAVLIVFISCIGLFGLSVLAAEKRTKEIGVRKVLGASVGSIVTLLSKDFLRLIMISLTIAIPFAWLAINEWLQNYPYRITPGFTLFTSAGVLVILIALFTISFQSIKAAMANPVKSLRTE